MLKCLNGDHRGINGCRAISGGTWRASFLLGSNRMTGDGRWGRTAGLLCPPDAVMIQQLSLLPIGGGELPGSACDLLTWISYTAVPGGRRQGGYCTKSRAVLQSKRVNLGLPEEGGSFPGGSGGEDRHEPPGNFQMGNRRFPQLKIRSDNSRLHSLFTIYEHEQAYGN